MNLVEGQSLQAPTVLFDKFNSCAELLASDIANHSGMA